MTGRFVAVGFQWSFTSAIQGLKRDIMAGEFGRARRMRTIVHYPRGMGYFSRNSWVGKLRTPAGHSVLDSPANNATAHFLHNMLYLLGRQVDTSSMPKRVQAELFRANEIENYDTAAIRVLTDEDVEVLFYTSHCVRVRQEPLCQFEFEKAVVEFDGGNGAELVARFHDGQVKRYGKLVNTADKLWHSVQCVGDGTRPCCGIKAAMAHLRTIVAAQRPREEISTFRAELQERHPMGEEDRIICVDGLDTGLMECFQHGALPSERRLPWSTVDRRAITPVVQLPRSGRRLRASTR
jgi:predicted dehydrogenase